MDEQKTQNKYEGVFEKKWARNMLIGVVVLLAAVIALKSTMQTMVVNKGYQNDSIALPEASNESFDGGGVANGVPAVNIGMSKLAAQDSAIAPMMSGGVVAPVDKKVVKNGDLSLKVGSADSAVKDISNISMANGGSVFSSN